MNDINMVGTMGTLATVCFIAAAVFLIAAVVMFFVFDVRKIRKELSGKQVENYMDEYRRKKEQNKRVGIYDPSGKLISDVKRSNVSARTPSGRIATPQTAAQTQYQQSMGDALAASKAAASVKSDNATRVLGAGNRKDFVIIKDFLFSESSDYIG